MNLFHAFPQKKKCIDKEREFDPHSLKRNSMKRNPTWGFADSAAKRHPNYFS